MLIGRGSERATIDKLLDAARAGRGGTLVLRGDPGIGKTALLEYAVERAPDFVTLYALGVETESELPFAGLDELLRPALAQLHELPEVQAEALRGALALATTPTSPLATAAATLGLLSATAEDAPLLCVVDDAQWLDDASRQALLFVARRIDLEPIALLLAFRTGERGAVETQGVPELIVPPLNRAAASLLLTRDGTELAPDVAERLLEAAEGNPLGLIELPVALTSAQRIGIAPLPETVAITSRLDAAFRRRIEQLSAAGRQSLLVAAAAEPAEPLQLDLSEARAAELVDSELRFRHPLVRSAVYHGASQHERRSAHATVADSIDSERHPDRHAWHRALAAASPDDEVADALEAAADRARSRGGLLAEARALEQAARLTTDDDIRARRLARTVSAAHDAGHRDWAWGLSEEALAATHDPALRANVQVLRVEMLYWLGETDRAREIALAEVEAVEALDPALAARILSGIGFVLSQRLEPLDALPLYERALAVAPVRLPGQVSRVAHTKLRLGSPEAAELVAEAAALEEAAKRPTGAAVEISWSLTILERYEQARTTIERALVEYRRTSALADLAFGLNGKVYVEARVGRLAAAHAAGAESVALSREIGGRLQQASGLGRLAGVEALVGATEQARDHGERALALAEPIEARRIVAETRHSLGLLELTLGRPEEAVLQLEAVRELLDAGGIEEPGFIPYGADLVEANLRAGRSREAERALERFEGQVEQTNRRWGRSAVARCRGMLGDIAAFETALHLHDADGRPLERARTHLAYGERLRREGRRVAAREELRRALELFTRHGATPWAERARAELAAAGETVRREHETREQLTPQELQVALAVSSGATNREAAAQLFLSPKTIEFHLRNTYRKLGVSSRTQLANALRQNRPDL